ncbi:MAG: hypothetical protein WKF84_27575 [Pyrinomonadaceae bacterium]
MTSLRVVVNVSATVCSRAGEKEFTHAILNPPYRKINSSSDTRLYLRAVGIETSNLYTAFLALTTRLLTSGGQLVAITPRSFCNGSYFRLVQKVIS